MKKKLGAAELPTSYKFKSSYIKISKKTQDLLITVKHQSVKTTSWFRIFDNKFIIF